MLVSISMDATIQNQFHIDRNWGLFIGTFTNNQLHKHYALQISISASGLFTVVDKEGATTKFEHCFIGSNVEHSFMSEEVAATLLINPLCAIGHQLIAEYGTKSIATLHFDLAYSLKGTLAAYKSREMDFITVAERIAHLLADYKCLCESENHFADDRIYKAIEYLDFNFERVVSLKEIAASCFLSESRFLHLFKKKTNLNFRRYQLWNKLVRSIAYLQNHSISETAYQFGFTDNSHYTRTFGETFGLSPKFLSKQE